MFSDASLQLWQDDRSDAVSFSVHLIRRPMMSIHLIVCDTDFDHVVNIVIPPYKLPFSL